MPSRLNLKEFISHVVDEELKQRPEGLTFNFDEEKVSDIGFKDVVMTAHLNGIEVGHIRVSWVPSQVFNVLYPDEQAFQASELRSIYYQTREELFDFAVDKPNVEFIYTEDNFKRKGIAIAMYEEMAKYLAKKGLKLYASPLQHDHAQAAWKWMKMNAGAHVGSEQGRLFLSFL